MRGLRSVLNQFRYMKSNHLIVSGIFALGMGIFGVLGILNQVEAQAAIVRDCDNNAIMYCGAENAGEFKQKFEANAPGDLPAIYGHYWIPKDLQVVQGQSFKDGTVRVNGKVVATNAKSIGRQPIPGSRPISIAGKTYYETPNSAAFVTDGLPTMVALDAQGNFKYAVISGCGNPIYATPTPPTPPKPTPAYTCDLLSAQQTGTFSRRFKIDARASGGAEIVGYRIDFGDGTAPKDSTSSTIDYTYAKAGNYTVKSIVKVKVDGKVVEVPGDKCQAQVVIEQPAADYACTALDVVKRSGKTYDFTIRKTEKNATYKGATVDFGDGTSETITGTAVSHTYTEVRDYTIVATLKFDVNGEVKDTKCQAKITATPCPTNPALPKDSPDCAECPYDSSLPKNSPDCKAPVTPAALPQTGPGELLMGGFGLASIITASSYYLASRRDLLATLLGK